MYFGLSGGGYDVSNWAAYIYLREGKHTECSLVTRF